MIELRNWLLECAKEPSIEFQLLFQDLPARTTTTTGRELAMERYSYIAKFFQRLQMEVEGEL